ncbi:Hydroxymethylpyrimidine/phosphomethylpyrimidine kinase [Geodia barretti]|uniref:Hydroxymethylpyrimidine/phosphomethylpyrimidine kinase n=1 Tax=Geodia barretti TaxID=519541 RepID=A0AA35RCY0_GEOBA|nr:Hydroxymethylpyrimidine/phosphomethylpyrimidine kinase [Geodia barretti]
MITTALTIAGSDSGGGAGIQADLKTFAALGVYGTSAITAITAQNTCGVDAVQAVDADVVAAQIRTVASDIPISAAKTGMLFSTDIIRAVAAAVRAANLPFLVVDPVMVATSGDRLLQPDAEASLQNEIIPLATVVTPNLAETEVLTGAKVHTLDDMRAAAEHLVAHGAAAVVVKGGHAMTKATDVFYDGNRMELLESVVVDTTSTHGTGCTFSAAICAYLARGATLLEAVRRAKTYLTGALQNADPIGQGSGPVGHFWNVTHAAD